MTASPVTWRASVTFAVLDESESGMRVLRRLFSSLKVLMLMKLRWTRPLFGLVASSSWRITLAPFLW